MPISVTFNVTGSLQTPGCTNFSLDLEPSSTIEQVKQHVQDKCGIAPGAMRIIFKGIILKNDADTLELLNVESGNTMHLVKSVAATNLAAGAAAANAMAPTVNGLSQNPAVMQLLTAQMEQRGLLPAATPGSASTPSTGMPQVGAGGANPMAAMLSDPALMQQMMSTPLMQQHFLQHQQDTQARRQLPRNEQIADLANMMRQNPLLQGLPAAQQEAMTRQVLASNPRATPALLDQAMAQLFPGGAARGAPGAAPAATPAPGALGAGGVPGAAPNTASAPGNQTQYCMERLSNSMANLRTHLEEEQRERALNASTASGAAPAPGAASGAAPGSMDPYQRFATQLTQLADMGFPDRPSNVQALEMANGDLNQAMNFLVDH